METKEIIFNGKKINIVVKMSEDEKCDYILNKNYEDENTIDLLNVIEQTQIVSLNGENNE